MNYLENATLFQYLFEKKKIEHGKSFNIYNLQRVFYHYKFN